MIKELQLRISLKEETIPEILLKKSAEWLSISRNDISGIKVLRKSIDARKPKIIVNYKMSSGKKYYDLKDFLKKHKTIPEKKFTHTALGQPPDSYPGSYCIEDEELSLFHNLYNKYVLDGFLQNPNKTNQLQVKVINTYWPKIELGPWQYVPSRFQVEILANSQHHLRTCNFMENHKA